MVRRGYPLSLSQLWLRPKVPSRSGRMGSSERGGEGEWGREREVERGSRRIWRAEERDRGREEKEWRAITGGSCSYLKSSREGKRIKAEWNSSKLAVGVNGIERVGKKESRQIGQLWGAHFFRGQVSLRGFFGFCARLDATP